MSSQRLSLISDELQERYETILSSNASISEMVDDPRLVDDFFQNVAEFVHFIRSVPEIGFPFERLLALKDSLSQNQQIVDLQDRASTLVSISSKELLAAIDDEVVRKVEEAKKQLSVNASWLDNLRMWCSHGPNNLELLVQSHMVLKATFGDRILEEDAKCRLEAYLQELERVLGNLQTGLEFNPRFRGYFDAIALNNVYARLVPSVEIKKKYLDSASLGAERILMEYSKLRRDWFISQREKLKASSKRIFGILKRDLMVGRGRSHVVGKLKSYMEWFHGEKAIGSQLKENQLATEVARFIFTQGFFPFIRFKGGPKEPDMYALSSHEEMLFELKRYRGSEKISRQSLDNAIAQSIEYLNLLKAKSPEIDDQVFLLVFHYNRGVPNLKENPVLCSGVFVHVVFIYLGKETPSTRRKAAR